MGAHLIVPFAELPIFKQPLVDVGFPPEADTAGLVKNRAVFLPDLLNGVFAQVSGQVVVMKARKPIPAAEKKGLETDARTVLHGAPFAAVTLYYCLFLPLEFGIDHLKIGAAEMSCAVLSEKRDVTFPV